MKGLDEALNKLSSSKGKGVYKNDTNLLDDGIKEIKKEVSHKIGAEGEVPRDVYSFKVVFDDLIDTKVFTDILTKNSLKCYLYWDCNSDSNVFMVHHKDDILSRSIMAVEGDSISFQEGEIGLATQLVDAYLKDTKPKSPREDKIVLHKKIKAAQYLYDDPEKIKKIIETVFEEEKLSIIAVITEEKSFGKMDLLQKITCAEILYEDKPDELKTEVTALLDEAGVKKSTKTYEQRINELFTEAGWFKKYMNLFAKHNPEFNKEVVSLEKVFGEDIPLKTKPYKNRIDLANVIFYGYSLLAGGAIEYIYLNSYQLGATIGLLFALSVEIGDKAWLLSENKKKLRQKARRLDNVLKQYS